MVVCAFTKRVCAFMKHVVRLQDLFVCLENSFLHLRHLFVRVRNLFVRSHNPRGALRLCGPLAGDLAPGKSERLSTLSPVALLLMIWANVSLGRANPGPL